LKPYFPVFGNGNIWLKLLVSQPKNYQSYSKGITLTELLVAMVVAGIILQLAYLGFSWNRQLYLNDVARNDASQTFKTAFDLVGSDIKQAGAGLDASFPAVLISPYPTSAGTPNLN
jgi:type IV pilus assembly protein PilW